jgi:hypothetical protein
MNVVLHPEDLKACLNTKDIETLPVNANSQAFTSLGNPTFTSVGNVEAVNSLAKTVFDQA